MSGGDRAKEEPEEGAAALMLQVRTTQGQAAMQGQAFALSQMLAAENSLKTAVSKASAASAATGS